jgi:hypothetical protein
LLVWAVALARVFGPKLAAIPVRLDGRTLLLAASIPTVGLLMSWLSRRGPRRPTFERDDDGDIDADLDL